MLKASEGLFQRAIMESNPLGLPMMPLAEAQDLGNKLATAFKCSGDDLACLRALPVSTIVQLQDTVNIFPDPFTDGVLNLALPHAPIVDGEFITDQVLGLVGAGNVNPNIPVIIGALFDQITLI